MESFLDTPVKKTIVATKMYISVYEYILFEHIRLSVRLCNNDDQVIDTRLFMLDGEDYNNWMLPPYLGDDNYIVDWIKKRLKDESQNN